MEENKRILEISKNSWSLYYYAKLETEGILRQIFAKLKLKSFRNLMKKNILQYNSGDSD